MTGLPAGASRGSPDARPAFDLARLQSQLRPLDLSAAPAPGDAETAYFRYYGIDFTAASSAVPQPVRHWFGHFPSGRYEIVAHYFEPPEPLGTCFVLHGYFDHAGLYRHVIEFCLQRRLAVVIYDLPGHGLSTGERATIADFAEYRQVLADAVERFRQRAPRPWRAVAQSTGGAVLMDYLLAAPQPEFEHCVLLAPLVRAMGWRGIRLSYALGRPVLNQIPRRFGTNSGDAAFVEFVAHHDPLQARILPLPWVGAMLKWERWFRRLPASARAPLVIQGQRDLTVAWRHNLRVIREKFPRARVLQLAQAQHHLANETAEIRAKMFAAVDMYWQQNSS